MTGELGNNQVGWRDPILRHFTPAIAAAGRLTVVVDEDALFTEPALLEAVDQAGFELLPSDDPMALRYAYETRVRSRRDAGESPRHAVVVCRHRPVEDSVPWDLLQLARRERSELAFGIAELFPQLAPGIVAELPRPMLDDLFAALALHAPGQRLGEQASREFVLRHVYRVAPELVQRDVDLLRVLLRRHYLGEVWPTSLDARFVSAVRAGGRFANWPLDRIVPERDTFFRFLAERWPRFVRSQVLSADDIASAGNLQLPGPSDLPFGHEDVRVFVDTLFLEGRIPRAREIPAAAVRDTWMVVGVEPDAVAIDDADTRINRLARLLADDLPSLDASHLMWGQAARRYSEWLAALRGAPPMVYAAHDRAPSWRATLEDRFGSWMLRRFAGLASLPPFPRPVMVHQVPEVMARELRGGAGKVALLVMDGMAGSQWTALRDSFMTTGTSITIDEDVVFAWVPTVTSVSRQALLAGEPPMYFGSTIGITARDEARWRTFWTREGMPVNAIAHVGQRESDGDDVFRGTVRDIARHPGVRALAVTCTAIDRMVHGNVGGERGLQAQVLHWAAEGHFRSIVLELLESGYVVYVTADHGNVPARGVGRPKVGDTPEVRGERVLVFSHEALRAATAANTAGAIVWPSVGLPEDYFALLAPKGGAFTTAGAEIIGHGGISLEEVVVPFVRLGSTS